MNVFRMLWGEFLSEGSSEDAVSGAIDHRNGWRQTSFLPPLFDNNFLRADSYSAPIPSTNTDNIRRIMIIIVVRLKLAPISLWVIIHFSNFEYNVYPIGEYISSPFTFISSLGKVCCFPLLRHLLLVHPHSSFRLIRPSFYHPPILW